MQFSDTTNKLGILQACERYTNLGDAAITGNTVLLKEFTAHANAANRRVWHIIFKSYGGWVYDDGNQTNLPQAADSLVSGTSTYALPSEALTINRIEVKDANGDWVKLEPMSQEMVDGGLPEFMETQGTPRLYRPIGNTIQLFPTPNYASTGGFKVFFDRDAVSFASTDTTKAPGFASPYHDAIPIGASIEWMKVKQPSSAVLKNLAVDMERLEAAIAEFYESRWRDHKPRIKAKPHNWR